LLGAADAGALVPEAACVLRALAGARGLEAAARRLIDLGHTSGWHLAAGLLVGVAHARRSAVRLPAFGRDGFGRSGTPLRRPVAGPPARRSVAGPPVGRPVEGSPVGAGRGS
ncbi:MAG: hypothetical protein ACRD07_17085, partial [Acidimicrobiales bacterium]